MWVRGLKRPVSRPKGYVCLSHPMWVRGLKHVYGKKQGYQIGRILCGCVD